MPALVLLLLAGLLYVGRDAVGAEITQLTDEYTRWDSLFKKYSKISGVPWRWIKAVCWVESDLGRADSVAYGLEHPEETEASKSSDGKSWGLMQTIITTSNEMRPGTTIADLNNPEISIMIGAKVLGRNLRKFPNNRTSVFRAYNGGLGFASTVAGQRDTPAYAAKVEDRLARILLKQPGDEMEIG